jgi:Alcohol dehydrogenase transcription factor Myb/SANT-like
MSHIDDYRLIKQYEECPILWDTRLQDYFSAMETKGQMWKDIAEKIGSTKGNLLLSFSLL